jgi:hypothetical protein
MWTNLIGISLLQAAGASIVLWLWTLFMVNTSKLILAANPPTTLVLVLILILLVIAAALLAGAMLGYPIYLISQKRWKTAITLIGLTLVWLGVLAAALISIY